ncbi:MAG: redoxin domain-containing protein, partial [Kiritimatiellaeota bacterium]|nr:redoxin domain-containing protein [Kiritimatiellota bacterium]
MSAQTAFAQNNAASGVGTKAPSLIYLPVSWVKGHVSSFQSGSIYVVHFWTCDNKLGSDTVTQLSPLEKKYQGKNVTFIGVATGKYGDVKDICNKKFVFGTIQHPMAYESGRTAYDSFKNAYGGNSVGNTFIIDTEGKFAWNGNISNVGKALDTILSGNDAGKTQTSSQPSSPPKDAGATGEMWQHPLFPWGATVANNPKLNEFISGAAQTKDDLGRVTALGLGDEFADYTIVMFNDV